MTVIKREGRYSSTKSNSRRKPKFQMISVRCLRKFLKRNIKFQFLKWMQILMPTRGPSFNKTSFTESYRKLYFVGWLQTENYYCTKHTMQRVRRGVKSYRIRPLIVEEYYFWGQVIHYIIFKYMSGESQKKHQIKTASFQLWNAYEEQWWFESGVILKFHRSNGFHSRQKLYWRLNMHFIL